jgi:NAD(P)-dependent dehydrogenase (short-subunit alcohol dehydrogenase family)
VAIVTGAARGIGFAIAQSLGKEGAAVVVSDVDDTAAAAAVGNLQEQGIKASFIHCDVSNSEQVSPREMQAAHAIAGPQTPMCTCSILGTW